MRSEGRRVPRTGAVAHPDPGEIERILKVHNIAYIREMKSHPAYWWKHQGRFLVDFQGTKKDLISLISADLKQNKTKV
jgi:signal recognition particle subunit SRP19